MHLKRKEASNSDQAVKRVRHGSESEDEQEVSQPNSPQSISDLLRLSDDVLLGIMAYLRPRDLLNLSRTCRRFEAVCRDRSLWTVVDLRPHHMMFCHLWDYVSFLRPTTELIATRGLSRFFPSTRCLKNSSKTLTEIFDTCKNLETFIAVQHVFDSQKVELSRFPHTLKKLSLRLCFLTNLPQCPSYFHKIHEIMPRLEVLDLSKCSWLTAHSLMAISKCPNLCELNLRGCQRLGDCVAYMSLAVRFGFGALKVLDVRQTYLSDSEISCFSRTTTLTHLYLEAARPYHEHSDSYESPDEHDPSNDGLPAQCRCTKISEKECDSKELLGESSSAVINSETKSKKLKHDHSSSDTIMNEDAIVSPSVSNSREQESFSNISLNIEHRKEEEQDTDAEEEEEEEAVVEAGVDERQINLFLLRPPAESLITDLGISSLGTERQGNDGVQINPRFIRLVAGDQVVSNPNLQHLVVKGFQSVTDHSLEHLAKVDSLRYLDITKTSVSSLGVQEFMMERPDVVLVSDHNTVS